MNDRRFGRSIAAFGSVTVDRFREVGSSVKGTEKEEDK
jgi:hypothetical protein